MYTVFRYTLRRSRGAIAGWGIGLAALAIMMGSLFDMMIGSGDAMLEVYMEAFPEISAMFDIAGMTTPIGWLDVEYFAFLPLIVGLFATGAGAAMLARDEERGTLDLILAHPVSRSGLFWGRFLATTVVIVLLLLISWGALLLTMTWSDEFRIPAADLLLPFISLFGILMFFLTLALLFSMFLPSRSTAGMAAGMLVAASFFVTLLSNAVEELGRAADFSPMSYLETAAAIENGLSLTWLGFFIGTSVGMALISWWRFKRRDIRVAGEGTLRVRDLFGRVGESARQRVSESANRRVSESTH
ncbi:MAG TPA: ABC transporter permease subunit [Anaerolineales bacterium]|nr:ABC transporter permease subunit [Anaerolineales bacterium]